MCKVSVIISSYNRSQGLKRAIDSLLEQSLDYDLWEIVVIDNNSSDDTNSLVHKIIDDNPSCHIRYVFEREQGLSFARNAGIKQAQGDYIIMVDDDQVFNKEFLQSYFAVFEADKSVDVAGGRVLPKYEFKVPSWLNRYTEGPIAGTVDFDSERKFFPSSRYPTGGNMAFRASVFSRVGDFNTQLGRKGSSLMGGEEKDLFERVNAPISYVYNAVVYHLIPESRLTKEYLYKVCLMIGKSERLRTKKRGIYSKRLFLEAVKWAGTLVFSLGYIFKGRFASASALCAMRLNISRGLLDNNGVD